MTAQDGRPGPAPETPGARRWVASLKLEGWPKTFVPMLLGLCIGAAAEGRWSPTAVALGLGFTAASTAHVVWLNDWADREVDALKRRRFPEGCSPKTIPDGLLPARAVLGAGVAAGAIALALGGLALLLGRGAAPLAALGGLAIFAAYSLPPLRLNYRGGGELLEMLGLGLFLPCFGAYLQTGELWSRELWVLLGFLPLCLASAVASGLADEETDREGGKVTFATTMGNEAARRLTEGCVAVAGVTWALSARLFPDLLHPLAWMAVVGLLYLHYQRLCASSKAAVTGAFEAQREYKRHLHRAVWHAGLALGGVIAWLG